MSHDDYVATDYVWVNDRIVRREEAVVTVFDHGFLYGDGCFESIQVTDSRAFMLDAHLDRLRRSLAALRIDPPAGTEELPDAIAQLLAANRLRDSFVKVVVTRGHGGPPLLNPQGLTPTLVIFAEHLLDIVRADGGVRLKTAALRRVPPWAVDAKIKSLNYLNPILAKIEALEAGADEALLLDENGEVAEATAYNLFVVHGRLIRNPWTAAALQGVTMSVVEGFAGGQDLEARRDRLTLADVYSADEVFMTSTAGGVIPVRSVDGRRMPAGAPGPVTAGLATTYAAALRDPEYTTELNIDNRVTVSEPAGP